MSPSFSGPSVVVAADGSVVGRFRAAELHEPIRPDGIPKTLGDSRAGQ